MLNLVPKIMDVYKNFLQRLQKLILEDICIILKDDIVPNLAGYVQNLLGVKFKDGSYHTFYGEVKHIIGSFLYYFSHTIDAAVKEADKFSHVMTRDELLLLTQRTIDINYDRQIFFGKNFLPVLKGVEKETYEEIEKMFEQYKDNLEKLKESVEKLDKQEKVNKFLQEQIPLSLKKTHELKELRVSLEEILLRTRNNLKKIREESDKDMHEKLSELYDKNKEYLHITRKNRKCSIETAEVNHSIQLIHGKIGKNKYTHTLQRLDEEVCFWEAKLKNFSEIADDLLKIKAEQENVKNQEQMYNTRRTTELAGSKKNCWLAMGENFKKRHLMLKDRLIEVSRTLITFFSIRSHNHILYKNSVGNYVMDEYNHKVYVFNSSMNLYHINCDGEFKEIDYTEKYYFDINGRYIRNEDGEKIYKCASCTSLYKLGDDNLLKKITQDCGHADNMVENCRLQFYKPTTKTEILPNIEPRDIKDTLEPEVVKYLWNSFGHVLPEALHDVALTQPKNPVQYLAHKILLHKYNKTFSEYWRMKKEAVEYRTKIFNERKEKAIKASKAWKAKQVKRRKPEESDDAEHRAAFVAHRAAQEHIASLNYYYD